MTMRLIVQFGPGGTRTLRLERGLVTIGRGQDSDLVLQDTQVSRHHAELRHYGDQWLIVDVGSTNGTFLGGARLRPNEPHALPPGVPVRIGDTQFIIEEEPAPPPDSQWRAPAPELPEEGAQIRIPEPTIQHSTSNIQNSLVWLARVVVVAGGVLLIIGSLLPWIRVGVSLPVLGRVLDQTYSGTDSGQAGLFIGVAAMALVLVVVDVVVRHERSGLAVGSGQVLAGLVAVVAAGLGFYRYYQVGTKEFLGISLVDILTNYLSNQVSISIQLGIYLAVAGLVILIVGGLLRLLSAVRA